MRHSRTLRLFLALVALVTASVATSAQIAPILDPRRAASDGQPVHDNVLLLPLSGQPARNRIDALLLPSKLRPRQQETTCVTNYSMCEGSSFCCPDGNACCPGGTCCGAGTYCTNIGGVEGCCKINHTCNQIVNQCTVEGHQRCPDDNFCCAAGDTCYRDADGLPKCSSGDVSISSSIAILPTPTSHSSLSSSSPSHSGTIPTPAATSSSQPTICNLKSTQPRGLLSRRRRASAHSAARRRTF